MQHASSLHEAPLNYPSGPLGHVSSSLFKALQNTRLIAASFFLGCSPRRLSLSQPLIRTFELVTGYTSLTSEESCIKIGRDRDVVFEWLMREAALAAPEVPRDDGFPRNRKLIVCTSVFVLLQVECFQCAATVDKTSLLGTQSSFPLGLSWLVDHTVRLPSLDALDFDCPHIKPSLRRSFLSANIE